MVAEMAALDLWTLFVSYVFGNFFMAVVGLALLMFIIMGILGKISVYTCMWYTIMFGVVMALGYGFIPVTIAVFILIVIALIFSWMSYFNSK